jgi:DnaJ-domain-containing protein 1
VKLPGRLSATTLGDILGALYRERASGVLELVEERGPNAGRSHSIHLSSGLVEHVETGLSVPRLGELLVREGLVGFDALRRLVRRLMFEPERRAGQILIEEGAATIDLVAAGLRRQRLSRLEALFQLRDALVRFHVPRPASAGAGDPPLTAPEFLHNRPRARSRAAPRGGRPLAAPNEERRLSAYRALGLPVNADAEAVRHAFRRLAAAVHPDRFPRATPAEKTHLLARFAEFSAAYHTLTG